MSRRNAFEAERFHGVCRRGRRHHPPQGRYAYRYKLEVPNGGTVTIKAGPARQTANYLKLEYKPDQVGANGASALAEYLSFVLGETYRDDFYLGNVNRIDITFDSPP